MSTTMAFDDEDDFRLENGVPKRKIGGRKRRDPVPAQSDKSADGQMSLFESVKQSEAIQRLLEIMKQIWTKMLELEQRIIASFERLAGVEDELQKQPCPVKEFYTSKDFAQMYGKKTETITKYLNEGKLLGEKTIVGRGETGEWRVSEEERQRYDREGLLRNDKPRRRPPRRPR